MEYLPRKHNTKVLDENGMKDHIAMAVFSHLQAITPLMTWKCPPWPNPNITIEKRQLLRKHKISGANLSRLVQINRLIKDQKSTNHF